LTDEERANAIALALLRTGGARGAFGSDGKAIQVGAAAAAGVRAALLARGGAKVNERALTGPVGFEEVFGARLPPGGDAGGRPAIERAWIKLHPSCLGTHSPIEAAARLRAENGEWGGTPPLRVTVHPTARRAAHLDLAGDGLEAKFSIPYCVAHTLIHGPPRRRDFEAVKPPVLELSRQIDVEVDASLPEFGAVLDAEGRELKRIAAPSGSPERPISANELASKVEDLAGAALEGVLVDLDAPAAGALDAAGLTGQRVR